MNTQLTRHSTNRDLIIDKWSNNTFKLVRMKRTDKFFNGRMQITETILWKNNRMVRFNKTFTKFNNDSSIKDRYIRRVNLKDSTNKKLVELRNYVYNYWS
jgi:hypothetical protein